MAHARRCHRSLIGDESIEVGGTVAGGTGIAIYSLSDPRDVRAPRYIGQTNNPARRHLQHLRGAKPWHMTGHEALWWQTPPRLRALYAWIRDLWQKEQLLPFMLVHEWVESPRAARSAERRRIADGIFVGLELFNIEALRLQDHPGRTLALSLTGHVRPRDPGSG